MSVQPFGPGAWLAQRGFIPGRLHFTVRTALAAFCAIALALALGLEHPQWAGMTVWAASMPVRSHLIERSLFRALGTVVGAAAGIVLLLVAGGGWPLVIGLSLWLGLCAGLGNLARGFTAYGAMLAGYTAAMVALLHSAHVDTPFAVGVDRMWTVLVGVAAALAVGLLYAAPQPEAAFDARLRALLSRAFRALATHFAGAAGAPGGARATAQDVDAARIALMGDLARLEEEFEAHAAGSLRARRQVHDLRRLVLALASAALWLRRQPPAGAATLVAPLRRAAAALEASAEAELAGTDQRGPQGVEALQRQAQLACDEVAAAATGMDGLAADLAAAAHALAVAARQDAGRADVAAAAPAANEATAMPWGVVRLHRDRAGAWEAMARAGLTAFATGALWLLTGWEAGPYMLLGAAIMTTVFSTAEAPTVMLRQVLLGQTLGVIAAFACRWLLWPHAASEWALVAMMAPFMLIGALLFAHRRGAGPVGFDYNMLVLLLLQPTLPLSGDVARWLELGVAVLLGPAVALVAYQLIYPVSARRRQRHLLGMMGADIAGIASRNSERRRLALRSRLLHRSLRLIRQVERSGGVTASALATAGALMLAAEAGLAVARSMEQPTISGRDRRRLHVALGRLAQFGKATEDTAAGVRASPDRQTRRDGDAAASLPTAHEALALSSDRALGAAWALRQAADSGAPGLDASLLRDAAAALSALALTQPATPA